MGMHTTTTCIVLQMQNVKQECVLIKYTFESEIDADKIQREIMDVR